MENKIKAIVLIKEDRSPGLEDWLGRLFTSVEYTQSRSNNDALKMLEEGQIDLIVDDLPNVSNLNDVLCIGALSHRSKVNYQLYVANEALDKAKDLRVKDNASFSVVNELMGQMIKSLRPDCEYHIHKNTDLQTVALHHDALITNADVVLEKHSKYDLHPSEFPPNAGNGVLAMMCRKDNFTLRKSLAGVHDSTIGMCTNVERKLEKFLIGQDFHNNGIYCEQDANGNYHVYLNYLDNENNLQKVKYSQSTNHQLVEKVIELIKNN